MLSLGQTREQTKRLRLFVEEEEEEKKEEDYFQKEGRSLLTAPRAQPLHSISFSVK